MTAEIQSKEYAEALFSVITEEGGDRDAYLDALRQIQVLFQTEARYPLLLSSPAIPAPERVAALREAFGAVLPKTLMFFLCLLVEQGRIMLLPEITSHFEGLVLMEEKISKAKVTSAMPLCKEEKDALRAALEKRCGHRVTVEYTVDGALLGGVTAELDGQMLDGSLRARLHQVKEVMEK